MISPQFIGIDLFVGIRFRSFFLVVWSVACVIKNDQPDFPWQHHETAVVFKNQKHFVSVRLCLFRSTTTR